MKKNRLLFLLPLLASFVLTSCDMLSNLNFNGPRKRSSHEDSEVLDDSDDDSIAASSSSKASSKSTGRTSSNTSSSSKKSSSSSVHQHTWTEWTVVLAPTCTESGEKMRECSICGESQFIQIPANGHTWSGWEVIQNPTCVANGARQRTCQVCYLKEAQTMQPLGHSYDYSNVAWETAPTCTQDGKGTARCSRCGNRVEVKTQATGHNYSLYDYQRPQSGLAETRVYRCQNCGDASLTFGVNSCTAESKSSLVFNDDDGGAQFWGRPIGNAVELSEEGRVDPDNHTPIYDETVKGSFFEIVFELTDNQAAALGEHSYLFCDAKPAAYMRQGRLDFFAAQTGAEEWTPGFYIDDILETPENEIGMRIEDYRYLLYVDDQPKLFDSSITNPVLSDYRTEFTIPYVFSLHAGINKIRLHMAGGYISTFYNFSFRPCEIPEHKHNWALQDVIAAPGEGYVGYTKYMCNEDGAIKLSIEATEGMLGEGSSFKSNTAPGYMRLAANGQSISYKFAYDGPEVTAKLYQVGYVDAWNNNKEKTYASSHNSGSTGLGPTGCNFGIKFNSLEVDIDEELKNTPFDVLLAEADIVVDETANFSNAGPCLIGNVSLVPGDNLLEFTRYNSYNLNIGQFIMVIE